MGNVSLLMQKITNIHIWNGKSTESKGSPYLDCHIHILQRPIKRLGLHQEWAYYSLIVAKENLIDNLNIDFIKVVNELLEVLLRLNLEDDRMQISEVVPKLGLHHSHTTSS